LNASASWEEIRSKDDIHFPGKMRSKTMQTMFFTPDCSKLSQYCPESPHFLWEDIQLSKGKLSKDRLVELLIDNDMVQLYYRSAPCNGVKQCSAPDVSTLFQFERKGLVQHIQAIRWLKQRTVQSIMLTFTHLTAKQASGDG